MVEVEFSGKEYRISGFVIGVQSSSIVVDFGCRNGRDPIGRDWGNHAAVNVYPVFLAARFLFDAAITL